MRRIGSSSSTTRMVDGAESSLTENRSTIGINTHVLTADGHYCVRVTREAQFCGTEPTGRSGEPAGLWKSERISCPYPRINSTLTITSLRCVNYWGKH